MWKQVCVVCAIALVSVLAGCASNNGSVEVRNDQTSSFCILYEPITGDDRDVYHPESLVVQKIIASNERWDENCGGAE